MAIERLASRGSTKPSIGSYGQAYGKGEIPKGMHVHHRDGDKLNNVIDNLELIDAVTHRRLHCGHALIYGIWHKPCRECFKMLPYEAFYEKPGKNGPSRHSFCKPCYNRRVIARRAAHVYP